MTSDTQREKVTILVADDDSAGREILCRRLAAHGFDTLQAEDGEQALAAFRTHQPDLVLLDVMMPKVDGLAVARAIKSDAGGGFTPVILVTAKVASEDVVTGLDAGADEYLTKPIDPQALVARVRSMLRIKKLHDQVQTQAGQLEEWNSALQSMQHGLGDVLSRADIATFAVEPSRKIHFQNAAATNLVGDLFSVVDGKLSVLNPAQRGLFEHAIAEAAAQPLSSSPSSSVIAASLKSYAIYVLPLRLAHAPGDRQVFAGASVLVLAVEFGGRVAANPAVLQKVLGLTPSEAKLASLIGTGMSPRDASEILNVTEETARTVLKRVFSKADVARQPELVALLNRLTLK
jgi:CheY-like chemotaxis protein/DNA-binding CsgD family transcriptional regulator